MINKLIRKNNKGFTLVELLVVIAIIGILAAVLVPNAFKAIEKSKVAGAISDYNAVKSAALSYYSDVGEWPEDSADAVGFITEPTTAPSGWMGPYIERWPSDNQWNGTFVYGKSDGTYFGTDSSEERYITLTNVSESSVERLTSELSADLVQQDDTDEDTVRLLISRE